MSIHLDSKKVLVALMIPVLFYFYWKDRPISQPDGVLVAEEPFQEILPPEKRIPLKINGTVVETLATYRIKARVLSKSNYWFDHGAKVSPIDLALGWGPMSDSAILDKLSISQGLRYYFVKWREPPLPESVLIRNSANVHIIPANDYIKAEVKSVRVGQVIELRGSLVMVSDKSGGEWKSSLTRDDTGNGACELMLVQQITKLGSNLN